MDRKPEVHLHAVPAVADNAVGGSNLVNPVDAEFIERSNAILITIAELWRGSDAIHKLPRDQMDWDGRMNVLTRIFRGRRDKAFVVNSRLEAMSQLVNSGKEPYGVTPMDTPGWNALASSVFLAVAKVPLLFNDREPYFESGQFAAFVLKDANVCRNLRLRAVRTRR